MRSSFIFTFFRRADCHDCFLEVHHTTPIHELLNPLS